MAVLKVDNIVVDFATRRGNARVLDHVNIEVNEGEILGIVGESGCGKSMTALALMGLLPEGAETAGRVLLDGENLLDLGDAAMCEIRGNRIGMVFQEPMTSLNPVHTIGQQVVEPLRLHRGLNRADAEAEAVRLLDRVGIPNPAQRLDSFPHQLSGGQRQRVMIAMALSCEPDLLIADEPTTALDVTIQNQILDLIAELVDELGMALILISHDLGVIAETVDQVMVMYGGAVVETGPTDTLFERLAHPYSQGLFAAMPRLGRLSGERLATIPGTVPDLAHLPAGCTFADRCHLAIDACRAAPPALTSVDTGHSAACIRLDVSLGAKATAS